MFLTSLTIWEMHAQTSSVVVHKHTYMYIWTGTITDLQHLLIKLHTLHSSAPPHPSFSPSFPHSLPPSLTLSLPPSSLILPPSSPTYALFPSLPPSLPPRQHTQKADIFSFVCDIFHQESGPSAQHLDNKL